MIWLLAHPPPTPSTSCLSFSIFQCVAGRAYWREGGRGWARSRIIRPRESLALYKAFSTLWSLFHSLQKKYWRIVTGQIGGENCMRRLAGPKDERQGLRRRGPGQNFPRQILSLIGRASGPCQLISISFPRLSLYLHLSISFPCNYHVCIGLPELPATRMHLECFNSALKCFLNISSPAYEWFTVITSVLLHSLYGLWVLVVPYIMTFIIYVTTVHIHSVWWSLIGMWHFS